MNCVALIPARAGSKRIPNKNVRPLQGVPLLAYTIRAALESGVFSNVFVSTDSTAYADIAYLSGAAFLMRPAEFATDTSPDIEWVEDALRRIDQRPRADAFSILRPTSPFRTPETIRRAWAEFSIDLDCDSLRAVERVRQHPGKMWTLVHYPSGRIGMAPFWDDVDNYTLPPGPPSHSRPTQSLPELYVQNASLEMAWTKTVTETHTISGTKVRPFFTQGYEGFDLNTEDDWILAEALLERGLVALPHIAPMGE